MPADSSPGPIRHNASLQRFDIEVDNQVAFLSYQHDRGRVILDHTFVPETLRGRGLAGVLAQAALEAARAEGWRIVPQCSFVASYLRRHPQFADLVDRCASG
jgi:hypothetical protein